jgi:survival-of-motor-neuron-related-splicing factor 30
MAQKSLSVLEEELVGYQTELTQVEELASEDPTNAEVAEIKTQLLELIKDTKELIALATKKEAPQPPAVSIDNIFLSPLATIPIDATPSPPVFDKGAAERAVAKGLFVGLECEALWGGDDQYYSCRVELITDDGVTVKFLGYGDTELVSPEHVRLESPQAAANRKKRKEPDQDNITEIPKHLQILPTDSEKVRQAKKKRIKALKLQMKVQAAEQERSSSKLAWKNFNDKIGKKKKTGYLTGAPVSYALGKLSS